MAVTGIFVMMVATVLSCANPMESAKSSIVGQYEISPIVESGNKEHPEYEWAEVQKNNPLNEGLKQQIEELDGVERVDVFTALKVSGGPFEEKNWNRIYQWSAGRIRRRAAKKESLKAMSHTRN